jgi:hypothetical protein
MAEQKLPTDLLTNPRERIADYIYEYAQKLRAYWCRHGVKDGKIYISTNPHLPGARDELVGTVYGIDVMVERQPKAKVAAIEVTPSEDGFDLQFNQTTVHVNGGPIHKWAERLFE